LPPSDLESAARQIEAAAQAFGSIGPERDFFAAWPAGFRALDSKCQAIAETQQALNARVDALSAPTQEMRRTWRSMACDAFSEAARDWLEEWRWMLLTAGAAACLVGAAVGFAGGWYAARSGVEVCAVPAVAVPGGVACWVRR
jgi:hypothetical protein